MERASLHQRLKSLLTKLSSWKEEQPDDVTSTVWNENRDLIYDGLTKKDTTCCTACQVMERMTTYEAPRIRRASWDDIGIRTAVVNLLVPASCPQEVKSLFSVPWQKLAAGIIRNCASDEETAKKMARDDKTVKAIICSTNDVRSSNERINSLEALANLARVEVNRDQLWADVEDPILRVARRPGKKAVREAAFDALSADGGALTAPVAAGGFEALWKTGPRCGLAARVQAPVLRCALLPCQHPGAGAQTS